MTLAISAEAKNRPLVRAFPGSVHAVDSMIFNIRSKQSIYSGKLKKKDVPKRKTTSTEEKGAPAEQKAPPARRRKKGPAQ